MWKEVINTSFYLSYNETDCYEILLTDYLSIWHAYFSRTQLLQCLKESNIKGLNMRDDVMLQRAVDIFSNPHDIKNADTKVENCILILTMTKQFGYPFKITINLQEGSKELFFQKITQPILRTVQELKNSQLELCDMLVKKDIEIKKLRDTGQTHSHEKTIVFNADVYLTNDSKIRNYFGSEEIPNSVLDKIVIPVEERRNVKQESDDDNIKNTKVEHNVKEEPDSRILENIAAFKTNGAETIKTEPGKTVKREIPSCSPKKRLKKLNL